MADQKAAKPLSPADIYARLEQLVGKESVPVFDDPMAADPAAKRGGEPSIHVAPDAIVRVATQLRDQTDLAFNSLMCLGGVDRGEEGFFVAYNLFSFTHRHRVTVKVPLARSNPKLKSVQGIWSAANWFERETFDLFGIEFEGHPDLRRLLLPPDWVGYPLRKDYEFPKEYNGISCERPKLK